MLSAAGTEAGQGAAPAAPGAQGELTEVHGWGRTAPARCQITALPTGAGSAPAAAAAIRACGPRGVLGRWLRRIRLIDGLGAAHELAPDGPDPDAFWATVGGMGLTGVITEATVAVPPTPSSWLQVSNTRAPNLDTLLSELDAAAHSHQHAVAWVDALATGRGSGRGIISAADPTDPGQPADPDRWGYHPADRPDLVPPIPLDRLDEQVAATGGRVYLAKDARLRPDLLGVMYPRLDAWRAVRDRLDPHGRFRSDLGARLGLTARA